MIDPDKNAEKRKVNKKQRPQHPIKGSSKLHLVAVSSDGEWLTRQYLHVSDENVMNLRIHGDDFDEIDDSVDEEEEEEEVNPQVIIDRDRFDGAKFELLTPGSYVALHSHTAFEQFYLVEVLDKGVSEIVMKDNHGHVIPANHHYMFGSYFEKEKEKRDYVQYKKSKNFQSVLINIDEIACVNIDFDGVKMNKEEYVSTCTEVLS